MSSVKQKEWKKENLERLKAYCNGKEMEIEYAFRTNTTESKILSSIVKSIDPKYYVRITKDDKLLLIVKNQNNVVCPPMEISDLDYFFYHFRFES